MPSPRPQIPTAERLTLENLTSDAIEDAATAFAATAGNANGDALRQLLQSMLHVQQRERPASAAPSEMQQDDEERQPQHMEELYIDLLPVQDKAERKVC